MFVDRLSKYAHFMTLTHPFTAKILVEKFVENMVKLHGMPMSIISDWDPIFVSKFWQEFFAMSGTKLKLISAYHPQTDEESEVVNRWLEQYLRSFVYQWPKKWTEFLSWAELWYNTTFHSSICMSPFQALYGCHHQTSRTIKRGSLLCMKLISSFSLGMNYYNSWRAT